MAMPVLGMVLLAAAVSVGTAALTLAVAARLIRSHGLRATGAALLSEAAARVVFLFDEDALHDATPAARGLLAGSPSGGSDWARLAALLRHRFPGIDTALGNLAEDGRVELVPRDGGGALVAEWRGGFARIVLADAAAGQGAAGDRGAERQTLAAIEAELATLRRIVQNGPVSVWMQAQDGSVVWANDTYFALAADVLGADEAYSWPPPALFPVAAGTMAEPVPAPVRSMLRPQDGRQPRWFECHGYSIGGDALCYALPADALVRAEEALREFVQTLSKTFADLPIGLAIFDRERRLALFNPALTDLIGLDIAFLAGRPTLFAFLDRLRDQRRIPEQRDYRSWRQRMMDLEAAAAGGFVQESWFLPTGQTFRVTGRPHPDGAVAFLFEDISAEISLTRRFRAEIELGQNVIDSFDEAIAVFSPGGTLTFSNRAYAELWGVDPTVTLCEVGIVEATRLWQAGTVPTPIWGDARDFLVQGGERSEWSGVVMLTDGRSLSCRFQPLPGGATLVGFSEARRGHAPAALRPPSRRKARA